jgi:hypothetical protein
LPESRSLTPPLTLDLVRAEDDLAAFPLVGPCQSNDDVAVVVALLDELELDAERGGVL